jgi:hypothetical protein
MEQSLCEAILKEPGRLGLVLRVSSVLWLKEKEGSLGRVCLGEPSALKEEMEAPATTSTTTEEVDGYVFLSSCLRPRV